MCISPFVHYAPVYVYNFMTILFQLKPDRSLDSQMNTKQQATFVSLVWQFGLYLCLLVAAQEFQTVFLQEETINNLLRAIWAHQVSVLFL